MALVSLLVAERRSLKHAVDTNENVVLLLKFLESVQPRGVLSPGESTSSGSSSPRRNRSQVADEVKMSEPDGLPSASARRKSAREKLDMKGESAESLQINLRKLRAERDEANARCARAEREAIRLRESCEREKTLREMSESAADEAERRFSGTRPCSSGE